MYTIRNCKLECVLKCGVQFIHNMYTILKCKLECVLVFESAICTQYVHNTYAIRTQYVNVNLSVC